MNTRKYGDKPTYREIAYEILYVNRGKPMYAKDIADKAKQMNMLPLVNTQPTSRTALYNTFASKLNMDKRFVRTAENTFGLVTFNPKRYDGHFRNIISQLKQERRDIASAHHEIQNQASPAPLTSIPLTPRTRPAQTCSNTSFGPHDLRIGRLEQIIEAKLGFELRLKTTAALRGGDVDRGEEVLNHLSVIIKQ
jgi:hypothetical protein